MAMIKSHSKQEKNRAVSPVVGVILMVAIAVILAAVVGTFVLDLGGDVSEPGQAGVTVDSIDETSVELTIVTLGNAEEVTANGETVGTEVGDSNSVDFNEDDRVTVIAVTPDGEETVIQTIEAP